MNRIQHIVAEAEACASNLSLEPYPSAPVLTMDNLVDQSGIDAWITVTKFGFTIGGGDGIFKALTAELDLTLVRPCLAIKTDTPSYYRTYDGVTSTTGLPWDRIVAHVQQSLPQTRTYRSADIPLRLTADLGVGATLVAPAGAVLGLSLSTTAWKIWEAFYRRLRLQKLQEALLMVKVSHDKRSNGVHEWGVPNFEQLAVLDPRSADAA